MALDCILAVRLSAAFDCLTPATTGTSRDPKTPGNVTSILQRGVISILRLKNRISVILENRGRGFIENRYQHARMSNPNSLCFILA